jgi:hypothetical protein
MDETYNPDQPEANQHHITPVQESEQQFLRRAATKAARVLSDNKRKALATTAAAVVGLGSAAAIESNLSSEPAPKANVPAAANNPMEIAKHLLWQAKNADPDNGKLISDHIWTGVIVLPPETVLYQAPDEAFQSASSMKKINIGKFVGPKDEPVVIKLPRMLAFGDGQVYIVANLKNDKQMENRATDPEENYWYPLEKAQAEGAKFMTYKNLPPSLGAVTVDADNNLKFGTFLPDQVGVMETIKQDLLEKEIAADEMVPTMPTAGR